MSAPSLPIPRAFVASLLSALPSPTQASTHNLADLKPKEKNLLLTLHVLFPNEFLPALDLLDRNLVTRFRIRQDTAPGAKDAATAPDAAAPVVAVAADPHANDDANRARNASAQPPPPTAPAPSSNEHDTSSAGARELIAPVYYVRSAQHQHQRRASRYGTPHDAATSYEVRLDAWNCSCPAFAFAAFPSEGPAAEGLDVLMGADSEDYGVRDDAEWSFGGLDLGEGNVPVCKHLLACVLVERCKLFEGHVEDGVVGLDEAAGWAAGWGG